MTNQYSILNEEDLGFLKAYLETEEKRKAFLVAYMYIIAPGMADGITEGSITIENLQMTINENSDGTIELNEGLIGNVLSFLKGKNAISKYYKGLDGAAKQYIKSAKAIDKMDQDKKTGKRDSTLKQYEDTVKALNDVKKSIDDLKKDSKILQKYDTFANNKYKIKLFLTGRKADVSLSKMKGYEDKIDDIKRKNQELKSDIDAANKEAEEKKPEEAPEDGEKDVQGDLDKKIKDAEDKEKSDKESSENSEKKEKLIKQKDDLKAEKKKLENLVKRNKDNPDEAQNIKLLKMQKQMNDLTTKIEKLSEGVLPLSFYLELNSLKESISCLENSIEEKL